MHENDKPCKDVGGRNVFLIFMQSITIMEKMLHITALII